MAEVRHRGDGELEDAESPPFVARFSLTPSGRPFTNDDWAALLDFADWHLRGKKTDRKFNRFPTEAELDAALQRKG